MKYGLIGHPIGHSYSPELHGILGNEDYLLTDINPGDLNSFFDSRDFLGINITIPYKREVIKFLDFISEDAKKIGCVNTIVNRNGKLYGYNTDGYGLEKLVLRVVPEGLTGKKVLILGTGGSSQTAEYVSAKLGAKSILKLSRNPSGKRTIGIDEIGSVSFGIDLIINCTPVGMFPDESLKLPYGIDVSDFGKLSGVVDLIYNPLRTNLIQFAQHNGIRSEGGLYMLCAQAARAHEIFFNSKSNLSDDDLFVTTLRLKRNVILIGMPSCGKSTVGRAIAAMSGIPFVDCDDEIEKISGKKIRCIFEEEGEPVFREIEKKVISDLCAHAQGRLIASGGGSVINAENVRNFKKNGVVVFIDRSPERLISTKDRPLSTDKDAIMKLYKERIGLYSSAADFTVDGNGSINDTAQEIMRILEI